MGEIDTCARGHFCMKFDSEQLLFQAFFHKMCIFAAWSPKVNLISRFCTLKDFKHTDLWRPLAQLVGEIDICARGLFCAKFNFEQLLFEAFFDVMRIFGRVETESEHTSLLSFIYISPAFLCVLFNKIRCTRPITFVYGSICSLHLREGL